MVSLVFVVHAHQPVGNLRQVVEKAFNSAYLPFLRVALEHPELRFGFHISGCLLDVAEHSYPAFLNAVEELLARSQIELLCGGYYEPVMSLLPERDSFGQIRMHIDYLRHRFRAEVEGIWLAERVWEQRFASIIAKSHLRYTLLDDNHLHWAGILKEYITGYYTTEHLGYTIAVFPIMEKLRYLIPFADVDEVSAFLKSFRGRDVILTYGDDAEKFGLWFGSHRLVYKEGWLRRFCRAVSENSEWLEMILPKEALNRFPPEGKVYIPECSYRELTEWALLPDSYTEYQNAKKKLTADNAGTFLRGAPFRNFLVKYPESNRMYGRMLEVSEKVAAERDETKREQALISLYKAQCNCAYWHGVFSGLHSPFLRNAVYGSLLEAENILSDGAVSIRRRDIELDRIADIRIDTPLLRVFVGELYFNIFELDYNPRCINLANTLSRRQENYHRRRGLTDPAPRHIGEQYMVPLGTPIIALRNPRYRANNVRTLDEPEMRYLPAAIETAAIVRLKAETVGELEISKRIRVRKEEASLSITYLITNSSNERLSLFFVTENNFSIPDDRGYILLPSGERRSISRLEVSERIGGFSLIHEAEKLNIRLSFKDGDCLFYPVRTRITDVFSHTNHYIYQCCCCCIVWSLDIEPEEVVMRELKIDVEG